MKISLFTWTETASEPPGQLIMKIILDFRRAVIVGEFGNQPCYSSHVKVLFITSSLKLGKLRLYDEKE
jgi:hypothetical protein